MNKTINVDNMHPEAANFIQDFYKLRDEYKQLKNELADATNTITTLTSQLESVEHAYKEVSEKADHYMRLSVEMRTCLSNMRALSIDAEHKFLAGLVRNNGAIVEPVENEVQGDDGKPVPKFLTERQLNDIEVNTAGAKKNGAW
jgi:chromosome segregation ATPase